MLSEHEIMAEFMAAEAILRGHFILSSGLHSDTYLQCARVLMNPARADKLCKALAEKLRTTVKEKIDLVVAPAMGGVIVGYEMGRQLGVETIFCEREAGEFTLRRGFTIPEGATILLVEDVVTTGLSSREAIAAVAAAGGTVIHAASLVDRSGGKADLGVPFTPLIRLDVPSYGPDALPPELAALPAIKPGSRAS